VQDTFGAKYLDFGYIKKKKRAALQVKNQKSAQTFAFTLKVNAYEMRVQF
jgi:hypothetical protein